MIWWPFQSYWWPRAKCTEGGGWLWALYDWDLLCNDSADYLTGVVLEMSHSLKTGVGVGIGGGVVMYKRVENAKMTLRQAYALYGRSSFGVGCTPICHWRNAELGSRRMTHSLKELWSKACTCNLNDTSENSNLQREQRNYIFYFKSVALKTDISLVCTAKVMRLQVYSYVQGYWFCQNLQLTWCA